MMATPAGIFDKLKIQAYEDQKYENRVGTPFSVLINPETYAFKYKIEFCETQVTSVR